MIQKLIQWFCKKYIKVDMTDIFKDHLHIAYDVVDFSKFDSAQSHDFLHNCYQITHNPAFKTVTDLLMKRQVKDTIEKGETELHFLCGKLGILTLLLWKQEFERYSVQYEDSKQPKQPIDKHAI